MGDSYTESYRDLYHGTTKTNAEKIIAMQMFKPSDTGWCGKGVYFYDIKAKAWWSADRTCRRSNIKDAPAIVVADIKDIKRVEVLDLRSFQDLSKFEKFVTSFLTESGGKIDIVEAKNEDDRVRQLRELFLNFYCSEKEIKLIIGHFKQVERVEFDVNFAEEWQLVIGIETIYCVKDTQIISNIRGRQSNGHFI